MGISESIKEQFKMSRVPSVINMLHDSVEQIIDKKYLINRLTESSKLEMYRFTSNQLPLIHGHIFQPGPYNILLERMATDAKTLLSHCRKEDGNGKIIGRSIFTKQSCLLVSWQIIEDTSQRLLKMSDQIFEGEGLRTGKEDGISQALELVFDTQMKNLSQLKSLLMNMSDLLNALANNFEQMDYWLGQNLKNGRVKDFITTATLPSTYQIYLQKEMIFDDVKDVIQAFDRQVEMRSREYASSVSKLYHQAFESFEHDLSKWLDLIQPFLNILKGIMRSYNEMIEVEIQHEGKHPERHYWGRLETLYPSYIREHIDSAYKLLNPTTDKIIEALYISQYAKNELSSLHSSLKNIIEKGVYSAFDLDEIVQSQKTIINLTSKIQAELGYVKMTIQNSMSGRTMTTLCMTLEKVITILNNFVSLTADCFGDNGNGYIRVSSMPSILN